jgi:hypothetical protein
VSFIYQTKYDINLDNSAHIYYNADIWHKGKLPSMIIRTRVFEMANGRYHNLSDLARAMGLSVSQVYRVREGKRGINEKFIIGAKRAFPECHLDELFYFNHDSKTGALAETTASR